ncbi:FadR family transcriptional regulator [Rhodococcus pyridinivorans]|uniref:FadR/GntR family transcriptional regulator n=1 Tax=Rhodococcus pyridinivorans TaxID=103816 RepID=UPI001E3872AB|nr:FadR/GntR family transcriptional regulator [Rhodococcus pyridinivorans]MCD5418811.1 FadR family transcriptional regulator [Rhodococcus pyridinivorans]
MNDPRSTATVDSFPTSTRTSASAGVELTQDLLRYLTSGQFQSNQRLPGERALAEHMGVGRTVIREAIRSLVLLGVLEVRQGDGTYLRGASSDLLPRVIEWGLLLGTHSIDSLAEARQYIEVDLAGLAADNRTDVDLARIQQWFYFMESAAETEDVAKFVEADTEFHLAIAAASGNTVLAGVLTNIRSMLRVWTERVLTTSVRLGDSLDVHRPIYLAIEAGNADDARAAMSEHMHQAIDNLRRVLDTSPLPTTRS